MSGVIVTAIIILILTIGVNQNRGTFLILGFLVAIGIGLIDIKSFFKDDAISIPLPKVEAKTNTIPPFDYHSGITFLDVSSNVNQASNTTEIEWIPTNSARGYGFKLRDKAVFYAQKYQIQPELFVALINQESRFNEKIVSPKGAVGLTQLMPETGKRFGCQPNERTDPDKNLECGAKYFSWLLRRFRNDERLALAGYNAGEGAVDKYGGIPPYKETQNYVRNIISHRDRMVKKNWLVASSS